MELAAPDPSHPPATAEEESLKRNTDCIYFLASPLTCKKGNDCEYRHNDGARMNPRDCWYWTNGNCLNSKCSFRHPPLDGFLVSPRTSSLGSFPSKNPSQTPAPSVSASVSYNPSKQSTPCYYFQKGNCLKGDKCPFMHTLNSTGTSTPQNGPQPTVPLSQNSSQIVHNSVWQKGPPNITNPPKQVITNTEPKQTPKKPSSIPISTSPHKNLAPVTENRIVVTNTKVSTGRPMSQSSISSTDTKKTVQMSSHDEGYSKSKLDFVTFHGQSARNKSVIHPSKEQDEYFLHQKEPGEFYRESSPGGFDVLVDNDFEEEDYFHGKDDHLRKPTQSFRHSSSANEYDYSRSPDYEIPSRNIDREPLDIVNHGFSVQEHYAKDHGKSSERSERKGLHKANPEEINPSDLRHRLSKQRRINGSRSATSPTRHYSREPSSISNRLQGRIKLPQRISPENDNVRSYGGDIGRNGNWSRLLPSQPISGRGRVHDRIKERMREDSLYEGRRLRGDEMATSTFAGPKTLSELKGTKLSGKGGDYPNKGIKSDVSLSFEGPKPLSVILKRKRETSLVKDEHENNGDDAKTPQMEEVNKENELFHNSKEPDATDQNEQDPIHNQNNGSLVNESTQNDDGLESKDPTIIDSVEDQDVEIYNEREGEEYEYDQSEGGDYNTEDYGVEAEESMDDEDGDDFATKLGVMFS